MSTAENKREMDGKGPIGVARDDSSEQRVSLGLVEFRDLYTSNLMSRFLVLVKMSNY